MAIGERSPICKYVNYTKKIRLQAWRRRRRICVIPRFHPSLTHTHFPSTCTPSLLHPVLNEGNVGEKSDVTEEEDGWGWDTQDMKSRQPCENDSDAAPPPGLFLLFASTQVAQFVCNQSDPGSGLLRLFAPDETHSAGCSHSLCHSCPSSLRFHFKKNCG